MKFKKITSVRRTSFVSKLALKIIILLFIIFSIVILIDKINFPHPNKKIEKTIPNENFKVVK